MKTIFVTVAEFLENGGVIDNERQTYSRWLNEEAEDVSFCEKITGDRFNQLLIDLSDFKDVADNVKNTIYVKINCAPIYK